MPQIVIAQLNAQLRPMDRGEYFEDPLDAILAERELGSVCGGGTLVSDVGEMLHSDVEIELNEGSEENYAAVIAALESLGAPKGSLLHVESEDRTIAFGVTEGLAVYLNGADLPKEVYAGNDINDFIEQLQAALGERGRFLSYWEGERETGLC